MSKNNPSTPDTDTRQQRLADLSARSLAAVQAQFDPVRHLVAQSATDQPDVRTNRQATSLPLAQALLTQGQPEAVHEAAAIFKRQWRAPRV